MKSIKIFAMAAVAIMVGLTSCNKNNDGVGANTLNGDPTFATISLNTGKAITRSAVEGTEGDVKEALVLIFGTDGNLFQVEEITGAALTKTFETKTGIYNYSIVVNHSSAGLAKATFDALVGSPVAEVLTMTNVVIGDLTDGSGKGYLMTNYGETGTRVSVPLQTLGAAAAAPFTIKVGRALAKVTVTEKVGMPNTIASLGTVAVQGYKTMNMPTKMNLLQQFEANALSTPFSKTAYSAANYFDGTYQATATNAYMVENSNVATVIGNTSYVQVKTVFSPLSAVTVDADGSTASTYVTGGDLWFFVKADGTVVNGKIFTAEPQAVVKNNWGVANSAALRHLVGGVMYYPVRIKDVNIADVNTPARYFVNRNMHYQITINKIEKMGIGVDQPYEQPEKPIDPIITEDGYASITIQVMPWDDSLMGEEL